MGVQRVIENYHKLGDLLLRKNRGYAGHVTQDDWVNFKEWEPLIPAHLAALSRAGDKWNRLKSLLSNPANDQVGESIFETFDDMINYVAIAKDAYMDWTIKQQVPVDEDTLGWLKQTG